MKAMYYIFGDIRTLYMTKRSVLNQVLQTIAAPVLVDVVDHVHNVSDGVVSGDLSETAVLAFQHY